MVKGRLRTVVPYHKTVRIGTLKAILTQIEMTIDEFLEFL